MIPTDLTKLREGHTSFYNGDDADECLDDLLQRAYRQGVEDCIAVAKDEAADTIDGAAATALAIVLARLEALKGGK